MSVEPLRPNEDLAVLANQWPKRTRKLIDMFAYLLTADTKKELVGRIPNQDQYKTYKNSVRMASVSGTEGFYVISANPKARRVKAIVTEKVLLYVRPRRRLGRVAPEITVLEKYSPWTAETMPFTPKRRDAVVVSRRVSASEVKKIARKRRRERPKWSVELAKVGVREVRKDRQVQIPKGVRAVPDVAFEGLRLEFGIGVKPVAHWRPAILWAKRNGPTLVIKGNRSLLQALGDPKFQRWKSWPPRVRAVRGGEMVKFIPFMKRLGIRF